MVYKILHLSISDRIFIHFASISSPFPIQSHSISPTPHRSVRWFFVGSSRTLYLYATATTVMCQISNQPTRFALYFCRVGFGWQACFGTVYIVGEMFRLNLFGKGTSLSNSVEKNSLNYNFCVLLRSGFLKFCATVFISEYVISLVLWSFLKSSACSFFLPWWFILIYS